MQHSEPRKSGSLTFWTNHKLQYITFSLHLISFIVRAMQSLNIPIPPPPPHLTIRASWIAVALLCCGRVCVYDVGGAHICADKSNDEYEGGAHTVHSCIGRGSCSAIIHNTNWGGSLGHVRPSWPLFFLRRFWGGIEDTDFDVELKV